MRRPGLGRAAITIERSMASRVGVACAICGVFCLPLTGGALYLLYAALAYDTVRLANRMALAAAAFLALIAMFLFLLHLMRMTRYRLDINGMTYTGFLGTKHWPWNQIAKARADTRKERLSSAGAPGEWVGLRVLRLETTDGRTHTTSLGAIGKQAEERLLGLISLAAGRLEAMKPVLELEGELRERGLGRAAGTGVAVLLTMLAAVLVIVYIDAQKAEHRGPSARSHTGFLNDEQAIAAFIAAQEAASLKAEEKAKTQAAIVEERLADLGKIVGVDTGELGPLLRRLIEAGGKQVVFIFSPTEATAGFAVLGSGRGFAEGATRVVAERLGEERAAVFRAYADDADLTGLRVEIRSGAMSRLKAGTTGAPAHSIIDDTTSITTLARNESALGATDEEILRATSLPRIERRPDEPDSLWFSGGLERADVEAWHRARGLGSYDRVAAALGVLGKFGSVDVEWRSGMLAETLTYRHIEFVDVVF